MTTEDQGPWFSGSPETVLAGYTRREPSGKVGKLSVRQLVAGVAGRFVAVLRLSQSAGGELANVGKRGLRKKVSRETGQIAQRRWKTESTAGPL